MEKIEKQIYGIIFLVGGIFLLIFVGVRLFDLLSKTFLYFMMIFFIVLMLYGLIFILIGILIISVNFRTKKSLSLIIISIGTVIIKLAITVIIIDSFTIVNIGEILSGIGLIYFGIKLFFHKIKLQPEEEKKEKKDIRILVFIAGLIISISYGFSIVVILVSFTLEYALFQLPSLSLPFLIGILLLIYSKFFIGIALTTQERKVRAILRFTFIILIFLYVLSLFLFTKFYL